MSQNLPPQRTMAEYGGLVARGFAMGCADVVPGVSGGTMAFILGIYEELLNSIRTFALPDTYKLLLSFDLKRIWLELPWRFLVAVFSGIVLAVLSLARALEWTLENEPILLWSFFFGLVLASCIVVRTRVREWGAQTFIAMLIGAVAAYVFVGLVPTETPNAWWFLFISGAIAICAMILPGISGSFLLLIMGKYQVILGSVNGLVDGLRAGVIDQILPNFMILFWVGLGAVIGIVSFAQVVSWLFHRYNDLTVALLIGLMFGSLRKIWPWKEVLEYRTNSDGHQVPFIEENVLPIINSDLFYGIVLMVVGFAVVFVLDYYAEAQG